MSSRLFARVALVAALGAGMLVATGSARANHLCNLSINTPGFHHLPHDQSCGGGTAVRINVSDVNLNLRGHTIDGQGTATYGVTIAPGQSDIVVRNGTIEGFLRSGVYVACSIEPCEGITLRNLEVLDNSDYGIDVDQADETLIVGGRVADTFGAAPPGAGIVVGSSDDLTIRNMVVADSEGAGIAVVGGDDVRISATTVRDSGGDGIRATPDAAQLADSDITIQNSLVRSSGETGIYLDERFMAIVRDTTVRDTGRYGIHSSCSPTGVIEDSVVRGGGSTLYWSGVRIDGPPCSYLASGEAWVIRNNSIRASGGNGVELSESVDHQLTDNIVWNNGDDGIVVESTASAVLMRNGSGSNDDDGFQFDTTSVELTDNTADLNTGFGYRTSGPVAADNRNLVGANNLAGGCSNYLDLPNTNC